MTGTLLHDPVIRAVDGAYAYSYDAGTLAIKAERQMSEEIVISPEMIQAGWKRIGELFDSSPELLAEEAFRAMMKVAVAQGIYLAAPRVRSPVDDHTPE